MVIDRTTGKGCALSIAAKTVTRNLIADGIIGKTIAKKERPMPAAGRSVAGKWTMTAGAAKPLRSTRAASASG